MCQRVPSESLLCPLVTLEEDDVWKWNSLSQIVQQINQSPYWTAQLLTSDGPAVRLCRQQNDAQQMPYECVINLVVRGRNQKISRVGARAESGCSLGSYFG
jgi:hypothetical protein